MIINAYPPYQYTRAPQIKYSIRHSATGIYPLTMKFFQAALTATLLASAAALDCSAKELAKYNFDSIKGVYTAKLNKDTPPLKLVLSWSVGICQNLDELSDCPKNSGLCGTTHVQVDGKDLLTEVIGFNSNLQTKYEPFSEEGDDKENGIRVSYKDVNWGENLVDATIKFTCAKGGDNEGQLVLKKWDGKTFEGELRTPAACASDKSNKKPPKEKSPDDTGESWGWFTWIFIFMVLFLSIYIIGGAWFQYNKGNAIDFQTALREVLENFVDLLRGLPAFFKEIVEKVTGNSNRGEYSAVWR